MMTYMAVLWDRCITYMAVLHTWLYYGIAITYIAVLWEAVVNPTFPESVDPWSFKSNWTVKI